MVAAHTLACAVAVAVLLAFPAFAAALPRPAAADFLSDAAASGSDSDEGPGAALRAHLGLEWRSELTVLAATAARVPLGAPVSLSLSPPALAPGGDLLLAGLLRNTSSGAGVAEGAEGRVSRGLQGADDDLVPPADDAQVDDATPESGWYETQRHPGLLLLMRVRGGAIGAPATDGDALLTEFAFAPQLGVLRDVSGVHVLGVANGDGQGNNTACVCVATAAAQAVCARLGVPWDLGRRADAWVSDAALDGARPVHVDRLQQHVRAPVRAVLAKADSPPSAPSGVLVAAYDAQLNPRSSWESLRLVGIPAQCPAQYATAEAPAVQPWVSRANASFNVGFGVTTNVRPFALSSPALATCSDAHGNFSVVVSAGHSTDNSGSSYVFAARAMTGERVWQYPAQNSFHPIIEQGGGGAVVVVPAASVRAMSGNVSNYRADLACYASGADFSLTCVDACTGDLVTSVNVDIDIPGNIPRAAVALGQPTLAPSSLVADLLHHACPHRVDAPSVLIPLSGPLGSVVVYSLCTDRGPPLSIGGSTALSAIATGYHSSSGDGSTELSPPAPVFVPTASSAARPVLCFGQPVVNVAGRGGNSDSLFKLSWPVAVQVGTYASCIELGLVDPNDVDFPDGVVTAARYAFLWTRPEAVFAMAQDDAGGVVFVASQSSWAAGSNFYYSASAECDVNELGAVAIDDHPVRQVCEACINVVDPGGTGDDTDGQPWVLVGALPDSPGLRLGMSSYNKVFSEAVLCTTMNNGRMKLGSGCQIGASDVWFPTTSGTSSSSLTSNIMCIDSVNGQHQGQGYDYNDDYGDDDLGSGLSSGPVVSVPTWNDDDITGRGGAVAMAVDCRAFVADMDGRMVLYILLSLSPAVFTVVALACLIVKRRRRYDVGGLSPLVLGSNCPTTNDLLQRLEREARRTTPPPDDRKFGCLRRSARRCCRLCRAPRHQVPSVTHAALLASVRRFNVFLGAAWVSGLLFNFAARAWAGLPFFEFFTATDHDCAAGTGNPDGLGLNYMSGTALQWSIVCGAVYSIAAFIRSRPTPDANLRFFGLLAAAPLIWSSIWVLEWSGGVMNGLGPQFAVALGGTSTIFWCTLALGQVLEVPIQHPFFASGAPWGALARSHRLGVYLVYCVGGWLVVLLCTPFGAWVQVNLTPLVAPGVVVLANQLLSVESRTALVGAVEAWRQLGSDMEVPTEAVDADATRKRTRLHPAVLVRVHALSSLLPLVVIGHAAGLLDVILLQLGRDGDNPYSIDGLPLPDGYLPGPVVYAVIVAMGAASVLRALALQSAVKRSGENALFRLRAGAMRLPPLLPPSVADSLRRARQDVLPAAGAGAARKKATGEPSMAEDVANWATSWSGQQVLSFTSHVTSISSLCFKLASGGMIDERGAQCIDFILSVNPAEVAVFAISISSVGFLVSLHTVLSRHFFPRVARMIPVDDSFRITIALKTTAIALKACLLSLGDADNKDASFYFLLFACVLSVVVLCFMLWVTTWTLMRAAMQSRRETLSKALESRTAYDAVLAGVATAADPDADLFPGVAHPRLLVFCYFIGFGASSVAAIAMFVSGGFSNQSVSWIMIVYAMILPSKWLNNELATYLRSRLSIIDKRRRRLARSTTVAGSDTGVGAARTPERQPLLSQAGDAKSDGEGADSMTQALLDTVVVGSSQSTEGVRPLVVFALAGTIGYVTFFALESASNDAGAIYAATGGGSSGSSSSGSGGGGDGSYICGPAGVGPGGVVSAIDVVLQAVGLTVCAALMLRTALILAALDGFWGVLNSMGRWRCWVTCCCCRCRCCTYQPSLPRSRSRSPSRSRSRTRPRSRSSVIGVPHGDDAAERSSSRSERLPSAGSGVGARPDVAFDALIDNSAPDAERRTVELKGQ